ncbi:MAG TPA: hypothetical protein PK157_21430 [Bryobacteraceae bacterium]|nr:hypothetical protein [Bryobacteraceae bacterium]
MEQIASWLIDERITYAQAITRIQERFGVKTSYGALCAFWQRVCEPRLLRDRIIRNAILDIHVRVRAGDEILAETNFSVAVRRAPDEIAPGGPIKFDCSTTHAERHAHSQTKKSEAH